MVCYNAKRGRTMRKTKKILRVVIPIIISLIFISLFIIRMIKRDNNLTKTNTNTITKTFEGGEDIMVYYIDIGAIDGVPGEAALIKKGNVDILVDSGQNTKQTWTNLNSFLKEKITDKTIEYAILTHPDTDHIGEMHNIYNNYTVNYTIRYDGKGTSNTATTFESLASDKSKVTEVGSYSTTNDTYDLKIDEGLNLKFLNTKCYDITSEKGNTTVANAKSIVFVLEAYNTRILFNGDAEAYQETNYRSLAGNVDIMKMGHHGSSNATTLDLLKAIDPEVVIATNGDYLGNSYKHPTYEAISRVYEYDPFSFVYSVSGGSSGDEDLNKDGVINYSDNLVDRNGTIDVVIKSDSYTLKRDGTTDSLIEMSSTDYWADRDSKYLAYSHKEK